MSSSIRIVRSFRRAGFYLEPDALELVTEFAEKYGEDVPSLVEEIVSVLAGSQATTIRHADLSPILEGFLKRGLLTEDADPLSLDTSPDRIIDDNNAGTRRHADPEAKWSRYLWRYQLLIWRFKRVEAPNRPEKLCEIKSLRETSHPVLLFGLLYESDGAYALEEPGGSVLLDLDACECSDRVFAESGFVVVVGRLVSDIFRVSKIGLPMVEARDKTLLHLPQSSFASRFSDQLELARITDVSAYKLAIFRDVYLDVPEVVRSLDRALTEIESDGAIGVIVIICGEFHSSPRSATPNDYAAIFQALSEIVSHHDILARQNRFVFVGSDFGYGTRALPHIGPAKFLVEQFRQRIRRADFPSNPARIWHGPDEIVVFRHMLAAQMKASSAFRVNADRALFAGNSHLHSILDQGHLVPVPDAIQPVYWSRDDALFLLPLPSILIVADDALDAVDDEYSGCRILSPDNFSRTLRYGLYSSLDRSFSIMHAR